MLAVSRRSTSSDRLQQQLSNHPNTGTADDCLRNAERSSNDSVGRPPTYRAGHPTVDGGLARPMGGSNPGRRNDELQQSMEPVQVPRLRREDSGGGTVHPR